MSLPSYEDEREIRTLVADYAAAVDARSSEGWAATWAPDGVWELPGGRTTEGVDALVPFWEAAMAGYPTATQQVFHGVVTDVDGDRATAWWSIGEVLRESDDGPVRQILGRYDDDYVRVDGRWRFAHRRYSIVAAW